MTNRQRFEELMEGQDPATVWRDRAFKLAAELDALSASPAPAASGGLEAVAQARRETAWALNKWKATMFTPELVEAIFTAPALKSLLDAALAAPAATGGEADQHLAAVAIASSIGGEEGWAWLRRYGGGETECVEAARAFDGRAFPAPSTGASVGVKVRALDWSEQNCGHATTWRAESSFGRYLVYMNPDNSWAFEPPGRFGGKIGFKSPNKAMAAAQSDFETRIRAALEGKS